MDNWYDDALSEDADLIATVLALVLGGVVILACAGGMAWILWRLLVLAVEVST